MEDIKVCLYELRVKKLTDIEVMMDKEYIKKAKGMKFRAFIDCDGELVFQGGYPDDDTWIEQDAKFSHTREVTDAEDRLKSVIDSVYEREHGKE